MENNEIEVKISNEFVEQPEKENKVENNNVKENESNNVKENEGKIANELLNLFIQKISQDKEFMTAINLDQKSLEIIHFILKNHPKVLENICNDIKNITEDKTISTNDIPTIILLCKDILNLYTESKNIKLTKIEIIDFIKNVIIILVKSNLIKINENEKDLIIDLINLSIKLLETKINLKKKCILKFW